MSEDGFSVYERDVTQRILHSETRIKNWVIGGVLANLLVLIGIGAPMVYYLGQLSSQTNAATQVLNTVTTDVGQIKGRMRELNYQQQAIIVHLRKQGYESPPVLGD